MKLFSDSEFLSLEPNPNFRIFELSIDKQSRINSELRIYSVDHEMIHFEILDSKSTTIELTQIPTGVYIVQLKNGFNIFVQRMIRY